MSSEETIVPAEEGNHENPVPELSTADDKKRPAESSLDAVAPPAKKATPAKKLLKRKVAMFFGYVGTGFQGFQRNPGARTIETTLIESIHKAGGITDQNLPDLKKFAWTRAARTDKGVHAAVNTVALKMLVDPSEPKQDFIGRVNSHLPEGIICYDYVETSRPFSAKNFCDNRTYEYLMPTFVLCPGLSKSSDNSDEHLTPALLQRGRDLLAKYTGSHRFHNFTIGKTAKEESSRRFIMSFTLSDPFVIDDVKVVRFLVKGQSFMLHQIRKMLGAVIMVLRGHWTEAQFEKTFEDGRFEVPMVPGDGLFLERCEYSAYEKRLQDEKRRVSPSDEKLVEDFKMKHIFKAIVAATKQAAAFDAWVDWLENVFICKSFGHVTNSSDTDAASLPQSADTHKIYNADYALGDEAVPAEDNDE